MNAAQPQDLSGTGSQASAKPVDALRHLFSAPLGEKEADALVEDAPKTAAAEDASVAEESTSFAPPQELDDAQAESVDVSDTAIKIDDLVEKIYPQDAPHAVARGGDTKVSRDDLVNVLESFVNLIKHTPEIKTARDLPAREQLSFEPGSVNQRVTVHVDDKTAEVDELRCLLVEAQETIIRLLTDRVDDRAHIASLETELKLLPDLQAQADRAIAVAMNTEDFRRELTKVKFELERVRLSKVRNEIEKNRRSWWKGVRGWFFKTREIMSQPDPESAPPNA